jgi:iron-sulfur cluster repair protein YtfE (RIC family)
MAEGKDFIEVVIEDHREAELIFDQIETLVHGESSGPSEVIQVRDLTNLVIAELVRHSVAEEEYLYPTVRARLDDGDRIAEFEIAQHDEAERTMTELEGMHPFTREFVDTLHRLEVQMREHAGQEEADLLPALAARMSLDERRDLAAKLEIAKAHAPTRPHPSEPDRPSLNDLLEPGVTVVVRVRYLLASRPVI